MSSSSSSSSSSTTTSRGALILFEGLDRSGKTTQAKMLVDYFSTNKIPVKHFRFPDRTTVIGKMIDAYLTSSTAVDDRVIHLLFSANRWEKAKEITDAIEAGYHVVLDRYVYSGVAFSASKGLDASWCIAPDIGLPQPDMVLFLNVSSDVAQSRGGFGQERYEKQDFQKKVGAIYASMAKEELWTIIDADAKPEVVHDEIVKQVTAIKMKSKLAVIIK